MLLKNLMNFNVDIIQNRIYDLNVGYINSFNDRSYICAGQIQIQNLIWLDFK